MEEVKVKSNYKDTIFRMLFSDKENLLSLYNALKFLSKNRAEAIAMSIFEYDEEKHIRNEKELSYQEGMEEGEDRLKRLHKRLLDENRIDELRKSIEDESYQKKLYEEYHI